MSRWVFFKWINRPTIPSGCLEIEDGYEPWGRGLFNSMALAIICLSYIHTDQYAAVVRACHVLVFWWKNFHILCCGEEENKTLIRIYIYIT